MVPVMTIQAAVAVVATTLISLPSSGNAARIGLNSYTFSNGTHSEPNNLTAHNVDDFKGQVREIQNNAPFFDSFFFQYWGVFLALCTGAFIYACKLDRELEDEANQPLLAKQESGMMPMVSGFYGRRPRNLSSDEATTLQPNSARSNSRVDIVLGAKKELELSANMWSLNLVACLGQAKTKRGYTVPAPVVLVFSIIMGSAQFLCLLLIVHDLDPTALPITDKDTIANMDRHSAWTTDPWTVNCMKWLMASYISIHAVDEAGQCKQGLLASLIVSKVRLRYTRALPIAMYLFQYLICLFVIWAGVSAILSLGSVPVILYSSMAIMFIVNIDETIYSFCKQVFDLQADFEVIHCGTAEDENEEFAEELEHGQFHNWVEVLMKILILLPVIFGSFLICRAWRTNVMPTDRVHLLKSAADDWLRR